MQRCSVSVWLLPVVCAVVSAAILSCQSPSDVDANRRLAYDTLVSVPTLYSVEPDSVDFSCTFVDLDAVRTVVIRNLDTARSLIINSIGLANGQQGFSLGAARLPIELMPRGVLGDSTTVTVNFTARSNGRFSDEIVIDGNSVGGEHTTQRMPVVANGIVFNKAVTVDTVRFDVPDSSAAQRVGTIRSSACSPITIYSFSIGGPGASYVSLSTFSAPAVINPDSSKQFTVVYSGAPKGTYVATCTFGVRAGAGDYLLNAVVLLRVAGG